MNRSTHEPDPTDAELVHRVQRGITAAFAELVSRYQDRVFNTCYRMCPNEADALDLTQATFLRALEALGQYQGRSSFYTWLFRIAINQSLSHRRTRRRRPTASLDSASDGRPGPPEPTGPHEEASALLERRELHARVERALERLDEEFRVPVILKDIEGLNYSDIGEILEIPVGTVKSRIHRGRLMLRDSLESEERSSDTAS